MNKIIASRGMGKTTMLINQMNQAIAEGKKVIFVTHNKQLLSELSKEYPETEFITFRELPFQIRDRRLDNIEVLIDELDLCIGSLLCKNDFTYTLTLGD